MKFALAPLALLITAQMAQAEMSVTLEAPWDGVTVPEGQQCDRQGGDGSTPPMAVSDAPDGTVELHVEFNDISYPSMAFNGGHGVIAWPATSRTVTLASVPSTTLDLPHEARVLSSARVFTDGYFCHTVQVDPGMFLRSP